MTENPLYTTYQRVRHVSTAHESLSPADRHAWLQWIIQQRAEFRRVHPDCCDTNGGVKPECHAVFVDFVTAKHAVRASA